MNASDDFNRADVNPLAAPWLSVIGGGARLASNAVTGQSFADSTSYYNSGTWGNDQASELDIVSTTTNQGYVGVVVRMSGSSGYAFATDGVSGVGHSELARWDSGTYVLLTGINTTFAPGDRIKLEVIGSTLTAYKNGVSVASVTDTTYTSGFPGVDMYNVGVGDNWSATDQVGAPGGPPPGLLPFDQRDYDLDFALLDPVVKAPECLAAILATAELRGAASSAVAHSAQSAAQLELRSGAGAAISHSAAQTSVAVTAEMASAAVAHSAQSAAQLELRSGAGAAIAHSAAQTGGAVTAVVTTVAIAQASTQIVQIELRAPVDAAMAQAAQPGAQLETRSCGSAAVSQAAVVVAAGNAVTVGMASAGFAVASIGAEQAEARSMAARAIAIAAASAAQLERRSIEAAAIAMATAMRAAAEVRAAASAAIAHASSSTGGASTRTASCTATGQAAIGAGSIGDIRGPGRGRVGNGGGSSGRVGGDALGHAGDRVGAEEV